MDDGIEIQKKALESLTKQFPNAEIISAFQPVSQTDFSLQKEKHLSRNAEGGAIGIISTPEGKIILTKRSGMHSGWSLPGGTVESNEEFLSAYKREIQEEIGVQVEDTKLMLVEKKEFLSPDNDRLYFLLAVFASKINELSLPETTIDAIKEGLEVALFSLDGLPDKMILGDKEKIDFYKRFMNPS